MSTEQVTTASATSEVTVASHVQIHPLSPITASEIRAAAGLVRRLYPSTTNFQFKTITLEEPEKARLVPYLEAEHNAQRLPKIDRKAFVCYYLRNTDKIHEAIINLTHNHVESNVRLGPNVHGPGSAEEILAVEKLTLEDEKVKAEIAKLGLPEGTAIVSDPWIYGSDGVDDDRRMYQAYLYMRDPNDPSNADSNHYAFPLPISPVVDTADMRVSRIDYLPTGADHTTRKPQPLDIHPPNEYTPEHQDLRTDLKPLNVVQPEGASFKITQVGETGEMIEWQKWSFRVGFNQREGMVLYDVRYDGRGLFYRLSLSDMNIPYADPRTPFHRKAAFDLGDVGAGITANNLELGCDCLGSIHYLDAVLNDEHGEPLPMENIVCVHEQDAGIGWKHTNYHTGRAAAVRNRELVVQSIITVANYEYIMAFMFNQAGELIYEVRATGILNTQPIDPGVTVPWGTVVHPGVLATHHQHVFSLRIDPAIDGHCNRLIYEEAHPMPRSAFNPHGIGYTVNETLVPTSAGLDIDYGVNRVYKIQNAAVRNPVNNKPVGYKIHTPPFQKMLADSESFHHKRAEFADHNIYAVRYHDGELYAGGKYTNQSRGGAGVRAWADRKENITDTDLVLFVQFGLQHSTRIEDFPVMPCEILRVSLKPANFFDRNPALDVPPSSQAFNKSTLVSEQHKQPAVEGVVGQKGEVCCTKELQFPSSTPNTISPPSAPASQEPFIPRHQLLSSKQATPQHHAPHNISKPPPTLPFESLSIQPTKMSQLQRHLTTNSNPPNQGRGRIPPASTTNQRIITLDGNPPNNGTPPSAQHPAPPTQTPTPPTNTLVTNALVTIPFAPAPTPHPIQLTPPTFLTYIPPPTTAPVPQPPTTALVPQPHPTPDWQYVMHPTGPLATPLPSHAHHPPPSPHTYTPPTALPLAHPLGGYYLPPTTPHTTLLHFPAGPSHPWHLPASALPPPKLYTVPLSIGIRDLIRSLGGETVGAGPNVGVTTCTLWRRGREVDPREWVQGGGRGGEMEWRRGETYTLGEGGGGGGEDWDVAGV